MRTFTKYDGINHRIDTKHMVDNQFVDLLLSLGWVETLEPKKEDLDADIETPKIRKNRNGNDFATIS